MRWWPEVVWSGVKAFARVAWDERSRRRTPSEMLLIGHRGAPGLAPENTIASFEHAIERGANAIEADVCITSDGAFVLWHDPDPDDPVALARQAGVERHPWVPDVPGFGSPYRRPVGELTLEELRTHCGYGKPFGDRDRRAVIATLDELLSWAASSPRLRAVFVDLKLAPDQREQAVAILERIWAAVGRDRRLRRIRFFVLSTHRPLAEAMAAARRRMGAWPVRIAWDFESAGALEGAEGLGLRDVVTGLTPSRLFWDLLAEVHQLVRARDAGKIDSVIVWSIHNRVKLALLLYHGVDGIMTDRPHVLRGLWRLIRPRARSTAAPATS